MKKEKHASRMIFFLALILLPTLAFSQQWGRPEGQRPPSPSVTTLTARPSARSIRAGETLTLDFDLQLSENDMTRVAIIQQGADLEYTLRYYPLREGPGPSHPEGQDSQPTPPAPPTQPPAPTEPAAPTQPSQPTQPGQPDSIIPLPGSTESGSLPDAEPLEETAPARVHFSMNREANERCTLLLTPAPAQTCLLRVSARMLFTDGTWLDYLSDDILVYTEEEIRSHPDAQTVIAGEALPVRWSVLGPEGLYTFRLFSALSRDGGQTWARLEEVPGFTLDTRSQEPATVVNSIIRSAEPGLVRLEAEVTLPDGSVLVNVTDPVTLSESV